MYEGLILIVDDQSIAVKDTIAALTKYVQSDQILYAENVNKAIKIIKDNPISLVFLDIEMPESDGFTLASWIEENTNNLPYVFLTGHANFALNSYEYEPVDFLVKPVDIVRLGKTFDKLTKNSNSNLNSKVALKSGQNYILVQPSEILYICKEKRKILINMTDGRVFQVTVTLDELENIFNDYGLFRCHQSFLVPLCKIKEVRSSKFGQTYEALLDKDVIISVSRGKYAELKEELIKLGILFVKGIIDKN